MEGAVALGGCSGVRVFRRLVVLGFALFCASGSWAGAPRVTEPEDWRAIVRATPYWESQGVSRNLRTIRQWVLRSQSYCSQSHRHILFDRRMAFLGYMNNAADPAQTQAELNALRKRLQQQGRVPYALEGTASSVGYPFALACDQPHAQLDVAISRMLGAQSDERAWGTWDGMRVGSPEAPVALYELIQQVYEQRRAQGVLSFPDYLLRYLLGQVLIESGGLKQSLSRARAQGIMQLMPQVLKDCGIEQEHRLHRMAQVDCAVRLYEQNHRVLSVPFANRFGALPEEKREELYGLLLVQAYHGGVGRVRDLLVDPELGAAAGYFSAQARSYSAADIALALIYHNLGRKDLGFASLYYLTDVGVATDALCARVELRKQSWCQQ